MGCAQQQEAVLTIAAAANMQFALSEVRDTFVQRTGQATNLILASSGKLTAQIEAGAPYHIFVSADEHYPQSLWEKGIGTTQPQVYAFGQLILWAPNDSLPPIPAQLKEPGITYIALPNPTVAPYGQAARQALQYYDLWEELQPKLVQGESVAQCNQFILSGAASLGFTAQSTIHNPNLSVLGAWAAVDSAAYQPIAQALLILPHARNLPVPSQAFVDLLVSETGQEILHKYGYRVPTPEK